MFKILGSRGSGKTYELIREASRTPNAVIVCRDPYGMKVKIKDYGFNNERTKAISYGEFINELHSSYNAYYIDEIETFLSTLHVDGYTMSVE